MKNVFAAFATTGLLFSQLAQAECKPIETPASCVLNPSYPSLHANCIRGVATRIGLGGFTTLPNGDFLLTGGKEYVNKNAIASKRAFIYKLASNSLCETASMLEGRHQSFVPVVMDNGRVLVAGGYTMYDATNKAEEFDIASESWAAVGSLPVKLSMYSAELLQDGSPMLSGGYILLKKSRNPSYSPNTINYIYDPASKTFSAQ